MRPLAAAVVLALLAGPSLGACGDCCPANPTPLTVSAAASCCGDCETTVGRASDPASLAAKASAYAPPAPAVFSVVALAPMVASRSAVLHAAVSAASPPSRSPLPLRL